MANTTIPNLPPAIAVTGAELIEIVQGGVSKRATIAQVGSGGLTLPVPIADGGTGQTTAAAAIQALLPSYVGNANRVLAVNAGETAVEWDVLPVSGIVQTVRGATFVSTTVLNPPINDVFFSPGYNCQIAGYRLYTAGGTGSCVVDVRKSTYAAFPPTSLDSICGANKPTISSGVSASDFVLTGWTTAVGATDVVGISLDSSSTFSMVTLQLFLEKT